MAVHTVIDAGAAHQPHQEGVVVRGSKVRGAIKNKKTTYILTVALACSVVSICSAQTRPGVNDFNAASWNSAGGRWGLRTNCISVQLLLANYGVDVIALQEAGSLARANLNLGNPPTAINILFLAGEQGEIEIPNFNPGVTEYVWTIGQQAYYIYYYDRNIADANLDPTNRPPAENRKINIAIVSKFRASQVIVIEPVVSTDADTNVNRPVLGIRVGQSFFFSVHPKPTNTNNEAPLIINAIQSFMSFTHRDLTWMAMGDFNRTPQDLMGARNLLPPPHRPNEYFRRPITTGQPTRTRELDYAVVGGPANYFIRNGQPVNHTAVHFQRAYPGINNPSDHTPVLYTKP